MSGLLRAGDIASMTALINSQANAALVKIERPDGLAPNGDPTYADLWAGEAPALLERREAVAVVQAADGDSTTLQLAGVADDDTLTVLDGVAPVIERAGPDWTASRITVDDQRTNPSKLRTFQVTKADRDMHGLLDSITLTLGPAR